MKQFFSILILLLFPFDLFSQEGNFYIRPILNSRIWHSSTYNGSSRWLLINNPFENIFIENWDFINSKFNAIYLGIMVGYKFPNSNSKLELGYRTDGANAGIVTYFINKDEFHDSSHVYLSQSSFSFHDGKPIDIISLVVHNEVFNSRKCKIFGSTRNKGVKADLFFGIGMAFRLHKITHYLDPAVYFQDQNHTYFVAAKGHNGYPRSPTFHFGFSLIPWIKNREILDLSFEYMKGLKVLFFTTLSVTEDNYTQAFYEAYSRGSGFKFSLSKRINTSKWFKKKSKS